MAQPAPGRLHTAFLLLNTELSVLRLICAASRQEGASLDEVVDHAVLSTEHTLKTVQLPLTLAQWI